jgi:hypothetical protein
MGHESHTDSWGPNNRSITYILGWGQPLMVMPLQRESSLRV